MRSSFGPIINSNYLALHKARVLCR